MTQTIDPAKLKAAAEHLERVLRQYPAEPVVQGLFKSLLPLIEDAKAGRVLDPISRKEIPGFHGFSDGVYTPYQNPSIDEAYVQFSREMRGGLTEQEKKIIASIKDASSESSP